MPFSLMHDVKVVFQGITIEDYTDTLYFALNAINIRSGKDTKHIAQNDLFGSTYVEPNKKTLDLVKKNVTINTQFTKVTDATDSLLKLNNIDAGTKKVTVEDSTADKTSKFNVLLLYKFNCTGVITDFNISNVLQLYKDTQLFWRKYRLINAQLKGLSADFIEKNYPFIQSTDFASGAVLNIPQAFSIAGTNCLFSENGRISVAYKSVVLNNGLDTVRTITFDGTYCKIMEDK